MAISPGALLGRHLTSPHLRWLVYRIGDFVTINSPTPSMLHCGCLGIQSSWFLHLHGCFVAPNEGWMRRMPEDTTATLVFSLWRWSFKRPRQLLKKIYESFCGTCYRQLRLRSSCCHLVVGPLFMAFIPHVLTITNPINSSHCLRWCIWRETSHNY